MVHLVRAFDEPRLITLDAKLHFEDYFVAVEDIHQNIFGDVGQSIPDTHDLEQLGSVMVDSKQLLIEADDLCFFGVAPAPEKISDVEGNELDVEAAASLCCEQSMNEGVEVDGEVYFAVLVEMSIEDASLGFEFGKVGEFIKQVVLTEGQLLFVVVTHDPLHLLADLLPLFLELILQSLQVFEVQKPFSVVVDLYEKISNSVPALFINVKF